MGMMDLTGVMKALGGWLHNLVNFIKTTELYIFKKCNFIFKILLSEKYTSLKFFKFAL